MCLNEIFHPYRNIIDVVDERMLVFDPKEDNEDFFFHGQRQQRRDLNKKANRDQKFAFDIVYGPNSTNEDVYQGNVTQIGKKKFTPKSLKLKKRFRETILYDVKYLISRNFCQIIVLVNFRYFFAIATVFNARYDVEKRESNC